MDSCIGWEASSCRSAMRQSLPGWSAGCTVTARSSAAGEAAAVCAAPETTTWGARPRTKVARTGAGRPGRVPETDKPPGSCGQAHPAGSRGGGG
eukprot:4945609-Alexandrium_andersonii.AAC.1